MQSARAPPESGSQEKDQRRVEMSSVSFLVSNTSNLLSQHAFNSFLAPSLPSDLSFFSLKISFSVFPYSFIHHIFPFTVHSWFSIFSFPLSLFSIIFFILYFILMIDIFLIFLSSSPWFYSFSLSWFLSSSLSLSSSLAWPSSFYVSFLSSPFPCPLPQSLTFP